MNFSDDTLLLLARCLYWTMPVVLLLWGVTAVLRLRSAGVGIVGFARQNLAGLVTALLLTVTMLWVSPAQMRMQFDETSLCGTAQNMHVNRTAMMGLAAVPTADGLEIFASKLDKRPPLFSFLVSVVHDLTGYRIQNAFAINLICLLSLLSMLAVFARSRAGPWAGVLAPLLVAAVPLVQAASTSAGFELLATTLLVAVILTALDYLAEPTPVRLQWLLANGLLFAQARYESVFVLVLVLALVWWRHRRLSPGRYGLALMLSAPVLLVPIAVLLAYSRDPGFYPEAAGRDLVAFGNLATNVGPFLASFFAPQLVGAFPGPLAIASVLLYALWLLRRRGSFADLVVLVPVLASTAVVWLWFYGDVSEPTSLRLYLPISVLAALGPLLLLLLLPNRVVAIVTVVAAVLFAVPRSLALHSGEIMPSSSTSRLLNQVDLVLENVPHSLERTVWVTTVSQYFIIHGHAAMTPKMFLSREDRTVENDVLVLTTPLDSRLPSAGDPQDVVNGRAVTELGRAQDPSSNAAFAVYRLRR